MQLDLPLEDKSNLYCITPKEVPIYKFRHPYGVINVYCATNQPLTPEKVYLLLEQAKHDLLAQHMAAFNIPESEDE